jgi:ribonuclease D
MSDYRVVDLATDDSLITLVESAERIGVDTEFMREKTYFAELCLLQVATDREIVCVDVLESDADGDRPGRDFWRALMQPEWVLHSARQDLEVVYQKSGLMPRSVFDTQIATALLGFQPQLGYAGLVAELFSVDLDKSHTRADWSRRPLSNALLKYAAEDVQYLLPAYDLLVKRLRDVDRLEWAVQDSMDLLNPALYDANPELAIERLKGARKLQGRARVAATRLAAWREREALRTNRPRQWVMRDQVLVAIAVACPRSRSALADIEGLAERTIRRAGDELLSIVEQAGDDESGYRPPTRPNERQRATLREMQKLVASCARRLGVAAELIAPKKELSAAVQGCLDSRVFSGWRRELVGDALLELVKNA